MKVAELRSAIAVLCFCSTGVMGFTLNDAIEHTLKTNPEMLSAMHEYEAREHEVTQARAGYFPRLSVSGGIGREERNAPATGNEDVDLTRKELGIQAEQIVFDGFASRSEVRRHEARVDSALHLATSTAEDIALRTTEVYLNVLRQTQLLDLTRKSLWEHQNIYDQMKLRSDTGVGSKADLDQIAARLALANANTVVAQNNLADARSNFYRVTGIYPNLDDMSRPEVTATLPMSIESALDNAIDKHPTLKSASADFSAAESQHKSAGSRYWPRVTIEAEKRWDEDIGGIEGEDEDLIVALRLNYDLFNGGANKARRKQTAKLIEQSKDIRNNTRRQVIESMNLSWNSYQAFTSQMVFLEEHVRAATATREAYKKQFNIGRRTLLDLLNTETEVVEAKRAMINAEYDMLFSKYRIFNASGELLSAAGVKIN